MYSWDNYRFMLALAQGRTMAAAARTLGTDSVTVGRRIEKLNDLFGRPVFQRTSDGWVLMPEYEPLMDVITDFAAKLSSVRNNLSQTEVEQPAQITIGCPHVIMTRVLLPAMREPLAPPRRINFNFVPRNYEDGLGDCDVTIRWGQPANGRLITRRAGTMQFALYRAVGPDTQTQISDGGWGGLSQHHDGFAPMRMAARHFGTAPALRVSQFDHLAVMLRARGVPGLLPCIIGDGDPDLERLPNGPDTDLDLWLSFHEARRDDLALRQSVDWILRAFRHSLGHSPQVPQAD